MAGDSGSTKKSDRERIRMIKLARIAACVLAAAVLSPAQEISFKLMGGLAMIQADDYNAGAAGAVRLLRDSASSVSGDYGRMRGGPNFQAEIITHWGRRIAVGIGGGLYEIRANGRITSRSDSESGPATVETRLTPKISVLPFYLNLYYKIRLSDRVGLDIFAGPVFEVVQFSSNRQTTSTQNALVESETYRASQIALGGQAGLGLSVKISPGLALIADGLYRYAKAANFSGNWALNSSSDTGAVTLSSAESFFWLYDSTQDGVYSLTGFFDAAGPTGEWISGARKAEFDLSGLTASAGIKISF
jgi:hypothetical protein